MRYKVRHRTRIGYAAPVSDARFNLRLRPVDWPGQVIADARLEVEPRPALLVDAAGPYVVNTTRLEFQADISELEITSSFTVAVDSPVLASQGPAMAQLRQLAVAARDLSPHAPAPYLSPSRIAVTERAIGVWGMADCALDVPVLEVAQRLAHRLHTEFTYTPGVTDSTTSPLAAFNARHGVCQDFAHVMIIALRWLGVPAGYASGYLRTVPAPGHEKLVGADAMHAWVMVWCGPDMGWIGVDPTNDCLAREDHILIAMGRDYADVAPIDGTFIGSAPQVMEGGVEVAELV